MITPAQLADHIAALGLKTEREYIEWCRTNNFSTSTNKPYHIRCKEIDRNRVIQAQLILKQSRKLRNDNETLLAIKNKKLTHMDFHSKGNSQNHWISIAFLYGKNERHANIFMNVLEHLVDRCDFWKECAHVARRDYIKAIYGVCFYHEHWISDYKDWEPKSHSSKKQFSSFVRHLFAKYDVPLFMDCVWFDENYCDWFWHVGQGGNIRTLHTPIPVTKKIAHYFLQAPDGYSIAQAIRYGQVKAMGGDEHLVKAIIGSKLGEFIHHEEFWDTVIKYFVQNPMLDRRQVGPIIDYLEDRKFVGEIDVPPEEPGLCMKGRDPVLLVKRVEEWHYNLAKMRRSKFGDMNWLPSKTIKPFEHESGIDTHHWKKWTVNELTNSKELSEEGREMKNCVASYARSCVSGHCTIWSIKLQDHEGIRNELTVEVSGGGVVQARGKYNAQPTAEQKNILARWANTSGLPIRAYVM